MLRTTIEREAQNLYGRRCFYKAERFHHDNQNSRLRARLSLPPLRNGRLIPTENRYRLLSGGREMPRPRSTMYRPAPLYAAATSGSSPRSYRLRSSGTRRPACSGQKRGRAWEIPTSDNGPPKRVGRAGQPGALGRTPTYHEHLRSMFGPFGNSPPTRLDKRPRHSVQTRVPAAQRFG